MGDRPVAAFILAIIGGMLMLVTAFLVLIVVDFIAPSYSSIPMFMAITGIVSGFVVVIGGCMIYILPEHRSALGGLIVAFSVMSFFSTGGLIIGMILGIMGGILGIAWKPRAGVVAAPTINAYYQQPPILHERPPSTRPFVSEPAYLEKSCHMCGSINVFEAVFCQSCGARIK